MVGENWGGLVSERAQPDCSQLGGGGGRCDRPRAFLSGALAMHSHNCTWLWMHTALVMCLLAALL